VNHLTGDVDFQKVHEILNLTPIYGFLIGQVEKSYEDLKIDNFRHFSTFSQSRHFEVTSLVFEFTVGRRI